MDYETTLCVGGRLDGHRLSRDELESFATDVPAEFDIIVAYPYHGPGSQHFREKYHFEINEEHGLHLVPG